MSLEAIFSLASGLAMLGWLGLVFVPKWAPARELIPSVIVPVILALIYTFLMLSFRDEASADGGFGTLAGVKACLRSMRYCSLVGFTIWPLIYLSARGL